MNKYIKKISSVLLAVSILATCAQSIPALAAEETATYTFDFNDECQAESFDFYKANKSDTNAYIDLNGTEGQLCFTPEAIETNKRVVLTEKINVKSVSVDIIPYEDNGTIDGGILLGDTGEVKANIFASTVVEFRLVDNNINDTIVTLQVARIDQNKRTIIASVRAERYRLQSNNESDPMRMTIHILDDCARVVVQRIDDKSKFLQTDIDFSTDLEGNPTGLTNEVLSGRVGLNTRYKGICFDNFTIVSPDTIKIPNSGTGDNSETMDNTGAADSSESIDNSSTDSQTGNKIDIKVLGCVIAGLMLCAIIVIIVVLGKRKKGKIDEDGKMKEK